MITEHSTSETILRALQTQVEKQGDAFAYTFLKSEDESVSITSRQLDQRARNIAQHLIAVADQGDRALMMYAPGLEFIEAFLGCLYAGVVVVPAYSPKKNRNDVKCSAPGNSCLFQSTNSVSSVPYVFSESAVIWRRVTDREESSNLLSDQSNVNCDTFLASHQPSSSVVKIIPY